jgi:hypothetical protein
MRTIYLLAACALIASGCSALVNPDESRLGNPSDVDGGLERDLGSDRDMATGDMYLNCAGGCDDVIACTADTCNAGECNHEPNDALCGEGERCNRGRGCVPYHCTTNGDCDDDAFCNGVETCDPAGGGTGCITGTAPQCADDFDCTVDSCNETSNACSHVANDGLCDDSIECTGDSCDPTETGHDAQGCVFAPDNSMCDSSFCMPGAVCSASLGCVGGAPRVCDADTDPCTDTACSDEMNMCVNVPHDGDGDTYAAHTIPGGSCAGTDCDDADENVHPGAMEICNAKDDNCDGETDEGCSDRPESCDALWPVTIDSDGHGHVSGNIADFSNDEDVRCASSDGNGRDAVYYIDLTSISDVVIETVGSTFDTTLAVGTECDVHAFEDACSDDVSPTVMQSRIFLHRAGPRPPVLSQRIYIIVKAYSGDASSGTYQLDVRVESAAADVCIGSPIDISSGGLMLGWSGGLLSSDLYSGECAESGASGREAVAAFSMPSDGSASFDAASGDFRPTLYVRRPTCTAASEVGCTTGSGGGGGGTASLDVSGLTSERYSVIIDGAPSTLATYTLVYVP